MNANLRRTLIALAITGLFASSMAYAGDPPNNWHNKGGQGQSQTPAQGVAAANNSQSTNGNKVDNQSAVQNNSSIGDKVGQDAGGNIGANVASGDDNEQSNAAGIVSDGSSTSAADNFAFTNSDQSSHHNKTYNDQTANNAGISGNAFDQVGGNVGVNVASGDNNGQSNEAALASDSSKDDDLSFAFSTADQSASHDRTDNIGATNNAGVSGNAFADAGGNLGINVVSGDNNEQLNALSASVGTSNASAMAISSVDQRSSGNDTKNDPALSWCFTLSPTTNNASLSGNAFSYAGGNIGINVASGTGNLQANSLSMGVTQ